MDRNVGDYVDDSKKGKKDKSVETRIYICNIYSREGLQGILNMYDSGNVHPRFEVRLIA